MFKRKANELIFDRETLRYSAMLMILVVLLTVVAAALELFIKNVPIAEYKEVSRLLLPELVWGLAPERNERIIYTICVILSPCLAILAAIICHPTQPQEKIANNWWLKNIPWLPYYLLLVVTVLACSNSILPDFLFRPLVRGNSITPWAICGIAALVLYLLETRAPNLCGGLPRRLTWGILLILPVFQTFFCRIYTPVNLHEINVHHVEIIAYSVSQAAAGRFDHDQYGLYSQMLAPLFRISGTSVLNISIIMGIIYIVAFWAMMRCAASYIRSRLWLLVIAVAIFIICTGTFSFLNDNRLEPYFAYYPIRFVFPAVGAWLFSIILKMPAVKHSHLVWLGIFCGIGALWNADGGIPVFAAFGAWLLAEFIFRPTKTKFLNGIIFGFASVATISLGYGVLKLVYGDLNLAEFYKAHQIFYLMGYYMLPMPLKLHPWQFVAAINLVGLLIGINGYLSRNPTRYSQFCLFAAVMSMGLFTYYQGRSHDLTLPATMWLPMVLLGSFCDRIFRANRAGLASFRPTLLGLPVLLLLALAVATPIMRADRVWQGLSNTWQGISSLGNTCPTEERAQFILFCAGNRRVVNIYGENQGIYYAETGLKAGISNFNRICLMLVQDKIRIFRELEKAATPLFISVLPGNVPTLPPPIMIRYRLVAVSPDRTIFFFEPALPSVSK